MAVSEAIAVLAFPEFCDLESRGDRRHELVGGRVYAMKSATARTTPGITMGAMARKPTS